MTLDFQATRDANDISPHPRARRQQPQNPQARDIEVRSPRPGLVDPSGTVAAERIGLGQQLSAGHTLIEGLFDRLEVRLDDRDADLVQLTAALRAHFAMMSAALPEVSKRIIYPQLAASQGAIWDAVREQLAHLSMINPHNLDFDQILQRLIELVLDRFDEERAVISALSARSPRDRLLLLGRDD